MKLLYALESIRTPFFDKLLSLLTHLGGETAFIAAAIIVFWCISKKCGYYMMTVGFSGTIINQFLKILCRIPRPWVQDPNFTIVESARAEATGYSFPSGHTQNAFAILGAPGTYTKNKVLKIVLYALVLIVAFSRMYLGVHTPLDVGVAFIAGLILMVVAYPMFINMDEKPKQVYILFSVFIAMAALFVLYMELCSFPADIDAANLAEASKNAYMMLGCSIGLLVDYHLDRTRIKFTTEAVWWAQIIKAGVGLAIALGIKSALKAPLLSLFGGHSVAHGIRYFIVVVFMGAIWPLTFKWFSKLGKK